MAGSLRDTMSDKKQDLPVSSLPVWSADMLRARRRRALLLAVVLGGLVVMFYLVTLVKLGANVAQRAL